jgi:hypothetical protein
MTREERLQIVSRAFDKVMWEIDGKKEFPKFSNDSMNAIVGASILLDRDPLALATLLSDGRLAEYIQAAEGTLPLSLDDPAPVRASMEDLLREAAEWVEKEREQLERRSARMLKRLDGDAEDYRSRARKLRGWQAAWDDTRHRWLLYREDWLRKRGLSGAPATPERDAGE